MGEGEQLSDGELLRIAESIKSKNSKIPDYLSEDDKKTVKELLDILYARDKAVKLYFTKIQYLDAAKRAQDLRATQEAKRLESMRRYKEYKAIMRAAQGVTDYLDGGYMRATESVEKIVLALGNDLFFCLDSRPFKRRFAVTMEGPEKVEEPMGRYIRGRIYRDFGSDELPFGKKMTLEEQERFKAYCKESRSPFTFKAFTVAAEAKNYATDNLLANPEALGAIGRTLSKEMDRRAREQRKTEQSMRGKAYGYQTKEYYEAMRDESVKKERLRLASVWYIVAAAGDLLCQFGQSLMNG